MKMRFPLFAIAAASVFAASCTSDKDLYDENYQNEVAELTYDQNFKKKFGTPALTQDFNAVENYQINVEASASKNIKIYAPSQNGVSKLVADYAISGNQTISFAAPEGTEVVYVVDDNGQVQAVNPNNGTVSIKATRFVFDANPDDNVTITNKNDSGIESANSIPDSKYKALVAKTNKFTVMYTKGAKSAVKCGVKEIGIYYFNQDNEIVDAQTWKPDAETLSNGDNSYGFTVKFEDRQGPISWGLYLVTKDGKKIYDFQTKADGSHIGSYNAIVADLKNNLRGYSAIGFDLDDNENYKDIIFLVDKKEVEIIDPVEFSYVMACEDLGNTDDFDFNDVVFSASYVAGREEMKVQALAAGGTLNSTISYNGELIGEIHDLLGAPSNTISNTTSITYPAKVVKSFKVSANLNLKEAMNNFEIQVVDGDKATRTITLPKGDNKAPQAICVPGDWFWPTERTCIGDAYENFTKWVTAQDQEEGIEWWKPTYVSGKVVVR